MPPGPSQTSHAAENDDDRSELIEQENRQNPPSPDSRLYASRIEITIGTGDELARIMHDLIMPSLTIRHVTTYRYRQPVAFGEHRMMLRPRDSHDQRVIEASLEISPEPRSLHFVQDAFGNHVGIARFSGRSKELCFESTVCLEHSPLDAADLDLEDAARTFPVVYSADEMPDLAYSM